MGCGASRIEDISAIIKNKESSLIVRGQITRPSNQKKSAEFRMFPSESKKRSSCSSNLKKGRGQSLLPPIRLKEFSLNEHSKGSDQLKFVNSVVSAAQQTLAQNTLESNYLHANLVNKDVYNIENDSANNYSREFHSINSRGNEQRILGGRNSSIVPSYLDNVIIGQLGSLYRPRFLSIYSSSSKPTNYMFKKLPKIQVTNSKMFFGNNHDKIEDSSSDSSMNSDDSKSLHEVLKYLESPDRFISNKN